MRAMPEADGDSSKREEGGRNRLEGRRASGFSRKSSRREHGSGTLGAAGHGQLEAIDPGKNVQALFVSPSCDMLKEVAPGMLSKGGEGVSGGGRVPGRGEEDPA